MVVTFLIQVKVRLSRDKGNLRLPVQAIQQGLQPESRSIELEGVFGTDDEMNLAIKVGRKGGPIGLYTVSDVVVLSPILDDQRIDAPRGAVKHAMATAVRVA